MNVIEQLHGSLKACIIEAADKTSVCCLMNPGADDLEEPIVIEDDEDDLIENAKCPLQIKDIFPCGKVGGCNKSEERDQPDHLLQCLLVKILKESQKPRIHIESVCSTLSKCYVFFYQTPPYRLVQEIKELINSKNFLGNYRITLTPEDECVLLPSENEIISLDSDDEDDNEYISDDCNIEINVDESYACSMGSMETCHPIDLDQYNIDDNQDEIEIHQSLPPNQRVVRSPHPISETQSNIDNEVNVNNSDHPKKDFVENQHPIGENQSNIDDNNNESFWVEEEKSLFITEGHHSAPYDRDHSLMINMDASEDDEDRLVIDESSADPPTCEKVNSPEPTANSYDIYSFEEERALQMERRNSSCSTPEHNQEDEHRVPRARFSLTNHILLDIIKKVGKSTFTISDLLHNITVINIMKEFRISKRNMYARIYAKLKNKSLFRYVNYRYCLAQPEEPHLKRRAEPMTYPPPKRLAFDTPLIQTSPISEPKVTAPNISPQQFFSPTSNIHRTPPMNNVAVPKTPSQQYSFSSNFNNSPNFAPGNSIYGESPSWEASIGVPNFAAQQNMSPTSNFFQRTQPLDHNPSPVAPKVSPLQTHAQHSRPNQLAESLLLTFAQVMRNRELTRADVLNIISSRYSFYFSSRDELEEIIKNYTQRHCVGIHRGDVISWYMTDETFYQICHQEMNQGEFR